MAGYTLSDMWRATNSKRNPTKVARDRLIREGHKVRYNVWGNTIAILNTKDKTLSTSDAGWRTLLTKNRLNQVIPSGLRVVQRQGNWKVQLPSGQLVNWKGGFKWNLKKFGY